jgi:hypothetical protein
MWERDTLEERWSSPCKASTPLRSRDLGTYNGPRTLLRQRRHVLETPARLAEGGRINIHLLVDAFPPGPQYHPRQPYMKEDDENA